VVCHHHASPTAPPKSSSEGRTLKHDRQSLKFKKYNPDKKSPPQPARVRLLYKTIKMLIINICY
jgi:hypothetical protein